MKRRTIVMSQATTILLALLATDGLPAQELPASNEEAVQRLNASPRHGDWVTYAAGDRDSVSAWIVYPERASNAPVVVVIHEIYGLTDWIRGVADQLASHGFIAIAPDLLSGKGEGGAGSESFDRQGAVRAVRALDDGEVARRVTAAARYATALPSARDAFAVIGFCWGGSTSFAFATRQPDLRGAVVYYGSSPDAGYDDIRAAVIGLYGSDDARVNATIRRARDAMNALGKRYEVEMYEGAGHGFLRAQDGRDGANMAATRRAWPRTVEFLREVLQ